MSWSARLVRLFERGHRVIAPTYPHHLRADELVDGLVRVLDARRLDKVDVFGHELGAGLAHALVRLHPDRVDRVALVGWGLARTLHRFSLSSLLWVMQFLPYRYLRDGMYHRYRDQVVSSGPDREAAALAKLGRALNHHTRDSALAELHLMTELSRETQWLHPLEKVSRPGRVLLLQANDDLWFDRAEQDALLDTYPQAQVVRFLWGGNVLGLAPALGLERKLELYFRPRAAFTPVEVTDR